MASGEKEISPLLGKNYKVSFPRGSMAEILDELEKVTSRPSQAPLDDIG